MLVNSSRIAMPGKLAVELSLPLDQSGFSVEAFAYEASSLLAGFGGTWNTSSTLPGIWPNMS